MSTRAAEAAPPPVSLPPAPTARDGEEEMDLEDSAAGPTPAAALPMTPGALPTPSALEVQAKSSRKAAKARGSGLPSTPRTSDDEMDVNPFLAASQRRERAAASKPPEKPKKNRITAPKDDT